MDAQTCLKKLSYVGVLSFATVDADGAPQVRCISAIHFETDSLYFFTARGKDFCRQLLADGRVQIMGYTMYKEMIRLSGKAEALTGETGQKWIETIFAEQAYLANVYPGDSRSIGIVFRIADAEIQYFNLGVRPIFRQTYTLGNGTVHARGFTITPACIGCGTCAKGCPQGAVEAGAPYRILQEHCLHCGRCAECCPVQAIRRL